MFIITGTKVELTYQVMSFMSKIYPNLIDVDIEVVQKDLTEDNVCLLYTSDAADDL